MKITTTTYTQTEPESINALIQTDVSIETNETYENCVSRVDPNIAIQEKNTTKHRATQKNLTFLPPKNVKNVKKVELLCRGSRKRQKFEATRQFDKKARLGSLKMSLGQYWYTIRNRLHVKDDCLLIDERIVLPTQLRQTILVGLHLTHPGRRPCWILAKTSVFRTYTDQL